MKQILCLSLSLSLSLSLRGSNESNKQHVTDTHAGRTTACMDGTYACLFMRRRWRQLAAAGWVTSLALTLSKSQRAIEVEISRGPQTARGWLVLPGQPDDAGYSEEQCNRGPGMHASIDQRTDYICIPILVYYHTCMPD